MTGKEKCKYLRELRIKIALENGVEFTPKECTHEGECSGTCPMCEQEIVDLTNEIRIKNGELPILSEIEECRLNEEVDEELAERKMLEKRRFTDPFEGGMCQLEGCPEE